jgi:type I restriction enzyme S subunit
MSSRKGFKETEFGIIPQDWELDILKNRTDIIMGQSPPSKFYNNKGIGIPFMQGRKTFGDKYHTIDTWCTQPKRIAKQYSILMSVRAPVGDLNVANTELCIGRGLSSINMKNGNNEFLYYLLKNYKIQIISKETGTVFGSINKLGIKNLKLPFPSEKEQERIASILSSLDEKIELNNQINKNLEKIAQVIFKHWFIDFEFPNENGEPYKSSGGEMTNSELGLIPKRWKIERLKKIIRFVKGKKPKVILKEKSDELSKYLTINVLSGKDYLYAHPKGVILTEKDNILMVMDGASSGKIYFGSNGIVASTIAKVEILNNNFSTECIYHFLKYNENEINNHTTGSAIPHTDKNFVLSLKIALPDANDIMFSKFNKAIGSIENKIIQNNDENKRLAKIRDSLLPKLMSGEIRVPINIKEGDE